MVDQIAQDKLIYLQNAIQSHKQRLEQLKNPLKQSQQNLNQYSTLNRLIKKDKLKTLQDKIAKEANKQRELQNIYQALQNGQQSQIHQYKEKTEYDIDLVIDSLSKLKKSNQWVFDLQGSNEKLKLANTPQEIIFLGVIGNKNVGKTHILTKLFSRNIDPSKLQSQGISAFFHKLNQNYEYKEF